MPTKTRNGATNGRTKLTEDTLRGDRLAAQLADMENKHAGERQEWERDREALKSLVDYLRSEMGQLDSELERQDDQLRDLRNDLAHQRLLVEDANEDADVARADLNIERFVHVQTREELHHQRERTSSARDDLFEVIRERHALGDAVLTAVIDGEVAIKGRCS